MNDQVCEVKRHRTADFQTLVCTLSARAYGLDSVEWLSDWTHW